MPALARTTVCSAIVIAFLAASELRAQSGGPTPACALLTVDDVRKATGRSEYPRSSDGDQLGEGAGGGSSCQYGGSSFAPGPHAPMVSFVLIPGKNWTKTSRGFKLAQGCTREDVKGVGEDAFFESCPTRSRRGPPLYAKVGTNDIIVQMDVEPPATVESTKQLVIAVAKAAVAKLR
jgi:hypothetical protein